MLPDQSSTGDLNDDGYDVASDEHPENELRAQPGFTAYVVANVLGPGDEFVDRDIDTGRKEDRRGYNEEVLQDEEDDSVWVLLGRESARDVADNLKGNSHKQWGEVPGSVPDHL